MTKYLSLLFIVLLLGCADETSRKIKSNKRLVRVEFISMENYFDCSVYLDTVTGQKYFMHDRCICPLVESEDQKLKNLEEFKNYESK